MKNSFFLIGIFLFLLASPILQATQNDLLAKNELIAPNTNNAPTINFKKFKNLNTALRYSAKEDKMLMLVFSATWCVPCQYMNDYVFNNKQISEFYNNNFISVYLDADRDKAFIADVHKQVGKVNTLPSFLFFDKDKYFAMQIEGSQSTSEFLEKGHRALQEQGYEPVLAGEQQNKQPDDTNFWQKIKNVFK